MTSRLWFVSWFRSVILAPATMAPLESRTDPVITPVAVWAAALENDRRTKSNKIRNLRMGIIDPPVAGAAGTASNAVIKQFSRFRVVFSSLLKSAPQAACASRRRFGIASFRSNCPNRFLGVYPFEHMYEV